MFVKRECGCVYLKTDAINAIKLYGCERGDPSCILSTMPICRVTEPVDYAEAKKMCDNIQLLINDGFKYRQIKELLK